MTIDELETLDLDPEYAVPAVISFLSIMCS